MARYKTIRWPDGSLKETQDVFNDGKGLRILYNKQGEKILEEQLDGLPLPERLVLNDLQLIAKLLIVPLLKNGELHLSAKEVELSSLLPSWRPGLLVETGDFLKWNGLLIECLEDHATDAQPSSVNEFWKFYNEMND